MHRFYCPRADFKQKTLAITDGNEVHHMKDVLRLKQGDALVIFNAHSQQAQAVIESITATEVTVRVQSVAEHVSQGCKIILACAVPKKAKFEFIIEKCTELGVDEIIPLQTKRTEVVFSKEKAGAKGARFDKVAVNAAKQSGRVSIPKIHPMTLLAHVLKNIEPGTLALIPSLNGQSRHIREVCAARTNNSPILIFIGPEGDFTPDEVRLAVEHGCVPVSLGRTVLKVDTAAITTVALARFLFQD